MFPVQGWPGEVGFVIESLRRLPLRPDGTTAFLCGPELSTNRAIPRLFGRYRRGPANGRESTADENVPVPGAPS